jgi:hypothetical protein
METGNARMKKRESALRGLIFMQEIEKAWKNKGKRTREAILILRKTIISSRLNINEFMPNSRVLFVNEPGRTSLG